MGQPCQKHRKQHPQAQRIQHLIRRFRHVNAGTLTLGNTHALSAAGGLFLTGTSVLMTSVQNAACNGLINISGTPEIDAPDSGTGSTTSILTLGGANPSFTGFPAINAGILSLGNIDSPGAASAISNAGGATLTTQTTGLSISAPVTLGAATTTSTISFGRSTAAKGTITLAGPISGDANLTFTTPNVSSGNNLHTIVPGSANLYAGSTLITTGNSGNIFSVKAAAANVLPATTVPKLNGGNGPGSGRTVTFELNGFEHTTAGLTNREPLWPVNRKSEWLASGAAPGFNQLQAGPVVAVETKEQFLSMVSNSESWHPLPGASLHLRLGLSSHFAS